MIARLWCRLFHGPREYARGLFGVPFMLCLVCRRCYSLHSGAYITRVPEGER